MHDDPWRRHEDVYEYTLEAPESWRVARDVSPLEPGAGARKRVDRLSVMLS